MRLRRVSLRGRLTAIAVAGAALTLTVLVVAFNVVLDARLRSDGDNVLRERAATVLRGLGTVNGRLAVIEALDQRAVDSQTWIFDGARTLERPAGADPRNDQAAQTIARTGTGFVNVEAIPACTPSRSNKRAGAWARSSSARRCRLTRARPRPR
jgi:hypothetical protein